MTGPYVWELVAVDKPQLSHLGHIVVADNEWHLGAWKEFGSPLQEQTRVAPWGQVGLLHWAPEFVLHSVKKTQDEKNKPDSIQSSNY